MKLQVSIVVILILCSAIALAQDADGDEYATDSIISDCNDQDASVFPGARESCLNYADDNCNGLINEYCDSASRTDLEVQDAGVYRGDIHTQFASTPGPESSASLVGQAFAAPQNSAKQQGILWPYMFVVTMIVAEFIYIVHGRRNINKN